MRAIEYLRAHPCVDCGETDIVVLQFDHLRDKTADVSALINSGATWAAIEREIAQPLSAFPFRSKSRRVTPVDLPRLSEEVSHAWYLRQSPNARRVDGYGRKVRDKLAARIDSYLEEHPCVDCGESNLIVLDFDHLRDKTDDVADMVALGRPWSEIESEIAKCQVRCANCHARRTARRIGAYMLALA